jgi:hypothetical protein
MVSVYIIRGLFLLMAHCRQVGRSYTEQSSRDFDRLPALWIDPLLTRTMALADRY